VDPGVASELDLVILDLEWSGSGRTGAPGALVLYPNRNSFNSNRNSSSLNRKEVKEKGLKRVNTGTKD